MIRGGEIVCGSGISYPEAVMRDLQPMCVKCGARFVTAEPKVQHVLSVHPQASAKLCRTWLCLTREPHSHNVIIAKNPLIASSSRNVNGISGKEEGAEMDAAKEEEAGDGADDEVLAGGEEAGEDEDEVFAGGA